MSQRISLRTLNAIADGMGYRNNIEVSQHVDRGGFEIRFGYWGGVDLDELIKVVPQNWIVSENEIDDDEDCGLLYSYTIRFGSN